MHNTFYINYHYQIYQLRQLPNTIKHISYPCFDFQPMFHLPLRVYKCHHLYQNFVPPLLFCLFIFGISKDTHKHQYYHHIDVYMWVLTSGVEQISYQKILTPTELHTHFLSSYQSDMKVTFRERRHGTR